MVYVNFKSKLLSDVIQVFGLIILSFATFFLITLCVPSKYIDISAAIVIIYFPAIYIIYKKDVVCFKASINYPFSYKYTVIGTLFFAALYIANYYFIPVISKLDIISKYTFIGVIVYLFVACVIAPIIEEIVFRYFLYTTCKDAFGVRVAFIISNIVFVAFHCLDSNLSNIAMQGVVYTYIYEKSKSLRSAIFVHFVNNSMWYLIAYARQ